MIKRAVWEAVYRELIADERKRLGEPPTAETLLAYSQGELDTDETARVQEFLILYPELARALVAPFPSSAEIRPGDPDYLSDEMLEQDWQAIQARLDKEPAVAVPATSGARKNLWFYLRGFFRDLLRRPQLATAASLGMIAVLGFLALRAEQHVQKLTQELATPRINLEHRVLLPDGERDAAGEETPILLRPQADHYLLTPTVAHLPSNPDYRLRLVEVEGAREKEVWSTEGLRPKDNTFEIWMPQTFLRSGDRHRLEVYGLRAGKPTLLAAYTVELRD